MKVYIAAASSEIERAEFFYQLITSQGIECTSSWIANVRSVGEGNPVAATFEDRKRWAEENLRAIDSSDVVWVLAPNTGVFSHGAFFELGYAIGLIRRRMPPMGLGGVSLAEQTKRLIDDLRPREREILRKRFGTDPEKLDQHKTPVIIASGGDHRWVFLALADQLHAKDVDALEYLYNRRTKEEQRERFPYPRREEHEHYTLVKDEPKGHNTDGLAWLETPCAGKCDRAYRIDPNHPQYAEIKAALDRGDRSVIHCYHNRITDFVNRKPA